MVVACIISDKLKSFKHKLDALWMNYAQGKAHITVLEKLDKGLSLYPDVYTQYQFYWLAALKAQFEAAQLHVMKMYKNIDTAGGALPLQTVIDYYNDKLKEDLPQPDQNVIQNELLNFEKEISDEKLKHVQASLKLIRDKHFAHLSKEYAESYDVLYKNYDDIRSELRTLLTLGGDVISTFYQVLYYDDENHAHKMAVTGQEDEPLEMIRALNRIVALK